MHLKGIQLSFKVPGLYNIILYIQISKRHAKSNMNIEHSQTLIKIVAEMFDVFMMTIGYHQI